MYGFAHGRALSKIFKKEYHIKIKKNIKNENI